MSRITEIETRLSAIKAELDNPEAKVEDLSKEVNSLMEERQALIDAGEKRKALLESIKNGAGTVIAVHEEDENIMPEKRTFALDSIEYRNAYLKSLQGKDLDAEERAAITASAVIPTQTLNKIVEKLEQTSVLFRHITVLNIPSNLTIPVEGTKNDASWVAMATASTDSADTFTSVSFAAYKLIKTIEITADVQAMSIDAFEAFIVAALTKKLSKAIENAILNGSGSSQPKGILKETYTANTNKITVGASASLSYDNVMGALALLGESYHQNAVMVMNRKMLFGSVALIKDDSKKPIFLQDTENGFIGKIAGYPVILDEYVPDDNIVIGDLSEYYFNFVKPITVELDNSVGFRTGSTCYRGMALCDGKVVNTSAFVVIDKAAS